MKKNYIAPECLSLVLTSTSLMAASGGFPITDTEVDEQGAKQDAWGFEEEEDLWPKHGTAEE